jgi:hypothetical protein
LYIWAYPINIRKNQAFVAHHLLTMGWNLGCPTKLSCTAPPLRLPGIIGACSLCSTLPKVIKTQCSASINLELLIVGICSLDAEGLIRVPGFPVSLLLWSMHQVSLVFMTLSYGDLVIHHG